MWSILFYQNMIQSHSSEVIHDSRFQKVYRIISGKSKETYGMTILLLAYLQACCKIDVRFQCFCLCHWFNCYYYHWIILNVVHSTSHDYRFHQYEQNWTYFMHATACKKPLGTADRQTDRQIKSIQYVHLYKPKQITNTSVPFITINICTWICFPQI